MDIRKFHVYYSFQASGETVEAESNVFMSEADIYAPLLGQLAETGDYIGLIDASGQAMQVMYKADTDQYWLEVIDEAAQGAHGRFFSFDEIVYIFKGLPDTFQPEFFAGLEFHTWEDLA